MRLLTAVALLACALGGVARAQDAGVDGADPGAADAAPPLAAPLVTVHGEVVARGTRERIAAATITVDGVEAAETDGDGRFELRLSPERHTIAALAPGHSPAQLTVDAAAGIVPPLRFTPTPRADAPAFETVVRAQRPQGPAVTLTGEELRKTPGALGDPFRVIESLPGVAPIISGIPVYAVRGANPGNTGFFVDGLRVPALFHFALGPGVLHPAFIESVDFYPGGYPASFGRYVAGVVSATTTSVPTDRPHGTADLRLYDAGASLTTPVSNGRGGLALAGRYSYTGALLSFVQNDVDISYWDYQGRFDHRIGPGRLTVFAFGSSDAFVPRNADDRDGSLELVFHRLDLRWSMPLAGGSLRVALAGGLDRTRSPVDDNPLVSRSRALIPRLELRAPLGPRAELTVGGEGELQHLDASVPNQRPELAEFTRSRTVSQLGAYASIVWRPHDRLELVPGFRIAHYTERGETRVAPEPRLSFRLRLTEHAWLRGAGGRFTQMPTLPLQLPGLEGFGLARWGLQSSWQGSLGPEVELPGWFTGTVTGFVQRYVLTDVRDFESRDVLLNDYLVRRDALSYGAEVMIKRPPASRLNGWVSYTLSRSLRAFEGDVVAPSDWDQTHILNVVSSVRFGQHRVGARLHLHTGREVRVDNTLLPEYRRLPTYVQLDARWERRFVFDRFLLDVYLELVNSTLARQYVELSRNVDGSLDRGGFRYVLPSLGVRGEF